MVISWRNTLMIAMSGIISTFYILSPHYSHYSYTFRYGDPRPVAINHLRLNGDQIQTVLFYLLYAIA